MELICFPLLNLRSKRAMLRVSRRRGNSKWKRMYSYNPRRNLVLRLVEELAITEDAVKHQILKERDFLLKQ